MSRLVGRAALARAFGLAASVLCAALATTHPARADRAAVTETRARDAYERGTIAYGKGDFARAAREFALADAILPDPTTLRIALAAATLADDPVLGTELLERAGRGPQDAPLAEAVASARARFAHRTGRIVIRCPAGARCLAAIDGAATDVLTPHVVAVGPHTVAIQGAGLAEQHIVDVAADETLEQRLAPAPVEPHPIAPPPPATVAPARLSPVWFAGAAVLTAAAGALTIASAVDTAGQHARFDDAGCALAPAPSCAGLATGGLAAQRRTDALLAGTGVLAVGAAALGIFWTRWAGPRKATVGVLVGGASVLVRATF
jgi:hypothetical protein